VLKSAAEVGEKGWKGKFWVRSRTVHVVMLRSASAGLGKVLLSLGSVSWSWVNMRAVEASPSKTPLFRLRELRRLKPRSRQPIRAVLSSVERRGWMAESSLCFPFASSQTASRLWPPDEAL